MIIPLLFATLGIRIPPEYLTPNQTISRDARYIIFEDLLLGKPYEIDSVLPVIDYEEILFYHTFDGLMTRRLRQELERRKTGGKKGFFDVIEFPLPKTKALSSLIGEKGKLDVDVSEKITFGGRQTYVSGEEFKTGGGGLPELEMKQELKVNLDGSVGEKIHILIDHDSERENESKNKIRLTYTGDEDEIVQEIEAGDIQLAIPPTTYTGDIPSHQGLFGIKTRTRIGPLELTAIASREESKAKQATFQGMTQLMTDTLYGRDYARRQFFYLGTHQGVSHIEVWIDDRDYTPDPGQILRKGQALIDTNDDNILDTLGYEGTWRELKRGEEYYFIAGANIIWLNQMLPYEHDLGVYYILEGGDTVGSMPDSGMITLKLIGPDRANIPAESPCWHYERKNRYYIREGVSLDSLKIYKRGEGGAVREMDEHNQPYVQILGLDPNKDGKIEIDRFNPGDGFLVFPDSFPFWSDKLSDPDTVIYTKWSLDPGEGMKYFIVAKYSIGQQFFNLGAFDILEGSEKVVVNGEVWERDRDYTIDYESGIITFKRELPPNADIKITYEYMPFMSFSQRSLFGLRGEMEPIENGKFGSSILYRSEGYRELYPTLESEPYSRMIWEADFAYPLKLDFLTNLIDRLPIVETDAPSTFTTNFEVALSRTVLNTRGEAYLDDFDKSTSFDRDFGVHPFTFWKPSSRPLTKDTSDFVHEHRLIYYNPEVQYVKGDILTSTPDPNTPVEILKVFFQPDQGNPSSFAGIMKGLEPWIDLKDCDMLELVVKGSGGRIHIDLATQLCEDQLRRDRAGNLVGYGKWDNEDRNRDGIFSVGDEDTGLDGVFGDDDKYPTIPGDVGNDDYESKDYSGGGINGTEGNTVWDNEDINRDRACTMEWMNQRFVSYSFHLDSSRFRIENASLRSGWKLFRIPIKDSTIFDTAVGEIDWEQISFIRIWFDGFIQPESLFFYKIAAVGSRWENRGVHAVDNSVVQDYEKVEISPVNTTTHGYYKPPRPLRRDEFGKLEEEGALEVRIDSLGKNHRAVIFRSNETDEDYRAYRAISLYLHHFHADLTFILRFGLDSLNYYEYRNRITRGEKGYNDYYYFRIDMEELIDLKRRTRGKDTLTRGNYKVVGNPSIASIHFFELSFLNDIGGLVSDTIWVNELKVEGSKVEVGRIARGSATLTLADVANASFNYNESNGLFKRLTDAPGISTSGRDRNYGFSSNVQLDKFLPKGWSFHIPLSYSQNVSKSWNRFSIYGTDIPLSPAEAERQTNRSWSDNLSITLSKSNSRNWLLRKTLDRMNFSWSRSRSDNISPLSMDSSYSKSRGVTYSLELFPKFHFGRTEISPLPPVFNLGLNLNDNWGSHYTRTDLDSAFTLQTHTFNRTANPSLSFDQTIYSFSGGKFYSSMSYGYNISQNRDLLPDSLYKDTVWYGEEIGRDQGFSASMSNRVAGLASPNINFSSSYSEDHRPEIRTERDLRSVNNSGELSFSGSVEIQRLLSFIAGLRDESKDTLVVKGSPQWLLIQLDKLGERLTAPSLRYSLSHSSSFPLIKRRPPLNYQFGMVDTIPVEDTTAQGLGSHQRRRLFSVNSGLNLNRISTRFGYTRTISRNFSFGTNVTETRSKTYPQLDLSVRGLERLPPLKRTFASVSANSYFEIGEELRGTIITDTATGEDSLDPTEYSKRYEFNPLVSLSTRLKKRPITVNIGTNYSRTKSTTFSSGMTTDILQESKGGNVSFSYSFSAPQGLKIPGLRGIKFRSELSVSITGSYQRTTQRNLTTGTKTSDYRTIQSDLGLSYNFSSSVKGGSTVEYSTNTDYILERTTKTIGINFWVLFLF